MRDDTLRLLNDVNRAIIQFRGLYSAWAAAHNIGYLQLLVYYTLREYGSCSQKQICNSYLLPKQSVHNVFAALRRQGVLAPCDREGREKVFVLTPRGREIAAPVFRALEEAEGNALRLLGEENLRRLTELMRQYDDALKRAFEEGCR